MADVEGSCQAPTKYEAVLDDGDVQSRLCGIAYCDIRVPNSGRLE